MNKRIRKKKGFSKISEEELWGLDVTLAKYILPRLVRFKEINTNSHPVDFADADEWHEALYKMIWSFERHLKDDFHSDNPEIYREESEKYREGLHLFAEYFGDLWD